MAKRSESSRRAILDATVRLLLADGATIQKLTIEAIAREAGTGKTTVYRWWPTKASVVVDALVETHLRHVPVPEGLPLLEAIEQHLSALVEEYSGPAGRLFAQLIAESQYDPEALATFRERFFDRRRDGIDALVRRGLKTGELPPDLDADLFGEMIYGPVTHRLLLGYLPLDQEFVQGLVRQAAKLIAPVPASGPA